MKSLFLLRHAKSSWDHEGLRDFDRPLNNRGLKAAKTMGQYILRQNYHFDLIVCSPAVRTRQTLDQLLPVTKLQVPVEFESRIYEASLADLVAVLHEIDVGVENLMVVGHNPGMENLLDFLTGEKKEVPTAALAVIKLEEGWKRLAPGKGRLDSFVRPKDLD